MTIADSLATSYLPFDPSPLVNFADTPAMSTAMMVLPRGESLLGRVLNVAEFKVPNKANNMVRLRKGEKFIARQQRG